MDTFKVVVHCNEPAELKWNSGDPSWVCCVCRKILRGIKQEMRAVRTNASSFVLDSKENTCRRS